MRRGTLALGVQTVCGLCLWPLCAPQVVPTPSLGLCDHSGEERGDSSPQAMTGLGCSQKVPPKHLGSGEGLLKASRMAFVDVCPHPSGEAKLGQGLPPKPHPLAPTPQPLDPGGLRPLYHPSVILSPSPSLWDFPEQSRL